MKNYFTILQFSIVLLNNTYAGTYFISNSGNDHNTGSQMAPFLTVQKGVDMLQPGDTLLLREGSFIIDKPIRINKKNGFSDKWFTIMAYPNEQVEIDGENYQEFETSISQGLESGLINIDSSSYVQILNIGVRHSITRGFSVMHSEYVKLDGCSSRATYNSGIGVRFTSYISILRCEVIDANNMRFKPKQITRVYREGPNEAISIMPAWHFEVAYNHVHKNRKEGIDCKENSAYGIVHHNNVHDNSRQGIYVDSWFGRLHHVEVYENRVYDNEYGITISSEGKNSTMDSVYIYNNLIYNNVASGIYFGVFNNDEKRSYIEVHHNTIINNGKPAHWSGITGGIELQSKNMEHIDIHSNICVGNYGYAIATTYKPEEVIAVLKEKDINISHNLCYPEKNISQAKFAYKAVYPYQGNDVLTFPLQMDDINDYLQIDDGRISTMGKNNTPIGIMHFNE